MHSRSSRQAEEGKATWREGRTRATVQSRQGDLGWGAGALLATLRGTDLLQRARAALKGLQLKSDLFRLVALHHRGNRKEAGLGVGEGWRQASPAEDKL